MENPHSFASLSLLPEESPRAITELSKQDVAIILDALFTTAGSHSHDYRPLLRGAAPRYTELANRILAQLRET